MKVSDFEEAINALSLGIIIDRIKLSRPGSVKQVNAHKNDGTVVVWDEHGRGFTVDKEEKETYITHDENGALKVVRGYKIKRNKIFDLKFD